jgi:EpsI family protein
VAARKKTAHGAIIVLFAALVAYTYAMRYRPAEAPVSPALDRIPREIAGYVSTEETIDGDATGLLGADATIFREYRRAGEPTIWLFVGYFASPQENSQIHSPRHCYPGAGWNILSEGTSLLSVDGARRAARNLVISNGAERHIVLYWFVAADGVLADEFALKWSQMKSSLLGRSRATSFVRFSMEVGEGADLESIERELVSFAEELAPFVEAAPERGAAPDAGRSPAP